MDKVLDIVDGMVVVVAAVVVDIVVAVAVVVVMVDIVVAVAVVVVMVDIVVAVAVVVLKCCCFALVIDIYR